VSERRWSIETLRAHPRIAVDANLLIYLIDQAEPRASRAAAVLDEVEASGLSASMATIGQVEALTGAARMGDATGFEVAADAIQSLGLEIQALSPPIAEDAAWIRGQGGLGLADAIHVASARAAGATAFITNDRRIRSRAGLEVLYLDDLELDGPSS
jgi:predicted nucleic acid-binding protein